MAQQGSERSRTVVVILSLSLLYAAGVLIFQNICDDAYISFRYARNLVDGHGLVWNPGEWVEGYTNFLWVLILALGMKLGVDPATTAAIGGVLAGAAVLWLLAQQCKERFGAGHLLAWLPVGLLVCNRSFLAWSTGGLATMFFTLLVFAGLLSYLRERDELVAWPMASSLLLALATLTRPDGGIFTCVVGIFFLQEVLRGRRGLRALVAWALPWFAVVGSHFAWRHATYGEWLPNTFHAKVGGAAWGQGFYYFGGSFLTHWYYLAAPLALIGLLQRRAPNRLFAASTALYGFYLLYIGGDHIAYRFTVPLLPMLAWMVAEGLEWAMAAAASRWSWSIERQGRTLILVAMTLVAVSLCATHSRITKASVHKVKSVKGLEIYAETRERDAAVLNDLVDRGLLPSNLRLAAGGIGALGYGTGLYLFDYRGLTSPQVAAQDSRGSWVGHQRMATAAQVAQTDMIDSLSQLYWTQGFKQQMKNAKKKTRVRWRDKDHRLRSACLLVDGGALVFTTPHIGGAFDAVFGKLEPCPS